MLQKQIQTFSLESRQIMHLSQLLASEIIVPRFNQNIYTLALYMLIVNQHLLINFLISKLFIPYVKYSNILELDYFHISLTYFSSVTTLKQHTMPYMINKT